MTDQARVPHLLFEHCHPAVLGITAEGEIPELILQCAAIVMRSVPDASLVRLVYSGDFIASVNARLSLEEGQDVYTLERGSGLVGGKTIPNDLGGSDIVLHAYMFATERSPDVDHAGIALMGLRTVAHEAQHAATHQLEAPFASAPGTSWRMHCLEALADDVIDEFRAESRVDPHLREFLERIWDGHEAVEEGRHAIGSAIAAYQDHRDLHRLIDNVLGPFSVMVKSLSVLLAIESDPAEEHLADQKWRTLAEPVWAEFSEILDSTRPLPLDRVARDASVVRLAEMFSRWLIVLGLTWTDVSFKITDFGLYEPELPPPT